MARAANFDLAGALASPSFTPGQRDAPALVELVVAGEEPAAQRAAIALAKLAETGRTAIDTRLAGAGPVGGDTAELGDASTARLVGALGLLARAGDGEAARVLVERTHDVHVRVRRAAISALGKLGGDAARTALLARWDAADVTPDERRTLAEALGKIGDAAIHQKLTELDPGTDAELARRQKRAMLMIARTSSRGQASDIDLDRTLAHPADVVLRCKRGLGPLLVEELAARGLSARATDDSAQLRLTTAWRALYASRLWMTAAIRMPLAPGELADAVVKTLTSNQVRDNLAALTRGEVRYRLSFPSKRRSLIWKLASRLPYLNDPSDSTWEFVIDEERRSIELIPKKADDRRFAWRVAELPASSHPTIAAALAFVAGAKPDERVWDPFAGAGAELIERAQLGPCTLVGSDLDPKAIEAARANLDAAGLQAAQLTLADARSFAPGAIDLIITNPPLGSRIHLDAKALLVAALPQFAQTLAPGGRLVWITPATRETSPVAESVGLRRTRHIAVDLGGVRGHLERWDRA